MTHQDGNKQNTSTGLLSRDWGIFILVSTLLIGLVFDTSISRVSGFEDVHDVRIDITIFTILGLFCLISQVIILNYVHKKVDRSFLFSGKLRVIIINKAVMIIQLGIIALILVILFEVTLSSNYHVILLKAIFVSSFFTGACVMGLLSSRFILWLRSNRNRISLTYLLASLCLSVSTIIGIAYVLDQLSYTSELVSPKPFGEFVLHTEIGDSTLANAYIISSVLAFILLWTGTVFLLHSYRKRLGALKYYILMLVPLLYFLSQFEPLILNVLFSYSFANPVLFSIIYVIMVNGSRPVGGILFGLSFIQVANKIRHREVKSYIIISAIGLLLLLVPYQADVLITAPFPPFGLLSASFLGLSCYLIFLGIYSSAVSVSQDSKLRASIRRSVETEINFIGNIGDAQMNRTIMQKVLKTSRMVSEDMPQETGIATSLTENEIADYINEVLREIQTHKGS